MKTHGIGLGLALVALLAHGSSARAQATSEPASRPSYWLTGGLGTSSMDWIAVAGGLTYRTGRSTLTVRSAGISEFCLCTQPDEFWDLGVLYGLSARSKYTYAGLSAGVGAVWGSRSFYQGDIFLEQDFLTVGIPLEAQLFFRPLPYFGIGAYGFGNLNAERSFGGALLAIQLGKLR